MDYEMEVTGDASHACGIAQESLMFQESAESCVPVFEELTLVGDGQWKEAQGAQRWMQPSMVARAGSRPGHLRFIAKASTVIGVSTLNHKSVFMIRTNKWYSRWRGRLSSSDRSRGHKRFRDLSCASLYFSRSTQKI